MAMSRGKKMLVGVLVVVVLILLVLPFVLGAALRGTVEAKIKEKVNAPVKLGALSVRLFPPGASLSDLELGEPSPLANNAPLAKIDSLSASVSMGSVFGGELHITRLAIDGADLQIGCDEKGQSTLTAFLANLPKSEPRVADLPIDSISVHNSTMTMHVPKALMAPKAGKTPGPVTVSLGRLAVSDLLLPAPGKMLSKEVWTSILIDDLKVRSPVEGEQELQTPAEAGAPMESGVAMAHAEGKLAFVSTANPKLRIKDVALNKLAIRQTLTADEMPDPFSRIALAREACLKSPPPDPDCPGMIIDSGSEYIAEVKISASQMEVAGPNPNGGVAYWRLADISAEAIRLGIGPDGGNAEEASPGHIHLKSVSRSSEGPGQFVMEWNEITGMYPEWSFKKKFEVAGVALTPFSVQAERNQGIQIKSGTLASAFQGETTKGNLIWDGSITISQDTKMGGKGVKGAISSSLGGLATGKPIEPIKIRGTLTHPEPQFVGVAGRLAQEFMSSVLLSREGGLLGLAGAFSQGAVVDNVLKAKEVISGQGQGVLEKSSDLMDKGIGGLFGKRKKGEEEKK